MLIELLANNLTTLIVIGHPNEPFSPAEAGSINFYEKNCWTTSTALLSA